MLKKSKENRTENKKSKSKRNSKELHKELKTRRRKKNRLEIRKRIPINQEIPNPEELMDKVEEHLPSWLKTKKRKTIPHKSAMRNKKRLQSIRNFSFKKTINFESIGKVARWILEIGIVCLLAFVFVWYFGQRVSTVGDSMSPVINNGDVVLVDRFIYNASSPKRGDIIVFKPKGNQNSHYYIKRVVALPGEEVEIIEGALYIDGNKMEEPYEATSIRDVGIVNSKIKLKGDEYFVLGDNRDKSEDSRMADIGNVKRSNIYGKAWLVVNPLSNFGIINRK